MLQTIIAFAKPARILTALALFAAIGIVFAADDAAARTYSCYQGTGGWYCR